MTKIDNLTKVVIKAEYSRHYPDPLNKGTEGDPVNIEHHVLLSRAVDVPTGISTEPNPRKQNIDHGIYKEIRKSLANADDLSFHLKNKGITILARRVEYSTDKKTAVLSLGDGDGIVDGGHTYKIVLDAQSDEQCPDGQYVKFEVLTGVPLDMGPDITGGLNTAVQVAPKSLMELRHQFQWIQEALSDSQFGEDIAYSENEDGEYDIREIIALMTLFHVKKYTYPNHPKQAYVSKAKCLQAFDDDEEQGTFKMLQPILKDILYLYDYVHLQSKKRYNRETKGKAGKMKGIYSERGKGYPFIFMNKKDLQQFAVQDRQYKLYDGALYPMLGAMRFLVEEDPVKHVYKWKLGSFQEVLSFFDEVAPQLVRATYETGRRYGNKPNPIGKDENHWDHMYQTVALQYLTKYATN